MIIFVEGVESPKRRDRINTLVSILNATLMSWTRFPNCVGDILDAVTNVRGATRLNGHTVVVDRFPLIVDQIFGESLRGETLLPPQAAARHLAKLFNDCNAVVLYQTPDEGESGGDNIVPLFPDDARSRTLKEYGNLLSLLRRHVPVIEVYPDTPHASVIKLLLAYRASRNSENFFVSKFEQEAGLPSPMGPSFLDSERFNAEYRSLMDSMHDIMKHQTTQDLPQLSQALLSLIVKVHALSHRMGLPWELMWGEYLQAEILRKGLDLAPVFGDEFMGRERVKLND